jgi:hypothetical protein
MAHDEQLIITECPFCDYASQYPGKVKKHLTDEHPLSTGMKISRFFLYRKKCISFR